MPPLPCPPRWRSAVVPVLAVTLALAATAASWALGQGDDPAGSPSILVLAVREAEPQPFARAAELAPLLRAERVEDGATVVLRGDGTTLTAFLGSPDAQIARGGAVTETSLSAPPFREGQETWLPLDVAGSFGARREGPATLVLADGRRVALAFEPPPRVRTDPNATLLHPAPGVVAVELLAPGAGGEPGVLAAFVTDLALAPLLAPWARREVDAALAEAGSARALLLVVTSARPGERHDGVSIRPEGARAGAPGARHVTLAGDREAIGPDAPWVAAVWLPPGTSLARPIEITFGTTRATVTFRR